MGFGGTAGFAVTVTLGATYVGLAASSVVSSGIAVSGSPAINTGSHIIGGESLLGSPAPDDIGSTYA